MNTTLKTFVLTLALVALPASAQTDDTATTDTTTTATTDTTTTATVEGEDRGPGFPWGLLGLLGLAGLMGRKAEPRTEVRLGGPTAGPRKS